MPYTIDKVDVWAGAIEDRPGGLAEILEPLAAAGANLEFVIARRDAPGKAVVFLTPLTGAKQTAAAKKAGLSKSEALQGLRVSGNDQAGAGAQMMRALANAGINCRGISAAAINKKAVVYFAFDNKADAAKARDVLKRTLKIK